MVEKPTTIGASTYQRIKHDILFGALAPGANLKLDMLRERYAASPSTLRETLNRLASEGFVAAPHQRGFFVTDVSTEDLVEIADLRVLLECHALRLSIGDGDTDWEGDLVAAHHKLHRIETRMLDGQDGEAEIWKLYDREFHIALIKACHSHNLLALHSILYDKYLRYQMLVLTHRGAPAIEEHREILEAALARDADHAARRLEDHIQSGVRHTLRAMQ